MKLRIAFYVLLGTTLLFASTKYRDLLITASTINSSVIGGTTPAAGTFTTLIAASLAGPLTGNVTGNVTGALTGNASTATALAATPTLCTTGQAPTGILANGNATGCAKIIYTGKASGCTTGAGTFNTCSVSITFGTAAPDTAYAVACTGVNPSDPRVGINGVAKFTTGVTVTQVTYGALAVNFGEIDCVASY